MNSKSNTRTMLTNSVPPLRLLSDERVSTDTSFDVVSTTDLKDYLEIGHSDDDTQIEAHRATAEDYFERITGHALNEQTRESEFSRTDRLFELPVYPVRSLDAVETEDEGDTDSMDKSGFYLRGRQPTKVVKKDATAWNSPADLVRITYTAGYTSVDDVPAGVVESIKKMVSDLYEFRTSLTQEGNVPRELTLSWKQLLTPYRIFRL